jgi:hypothetical protein
MSIQSLKSAIDTRVRIDYTQWAAANRIQGHHSETCPAGSAHLRNDVYGRSVNSNTLDMRSASCNAHAPYEQTLHGHIQRENNERPYLPIATAGHRGDGDFMGRGRDLMPQNLYGDGNRGNFVRHGTNGNQLPQPRHQTPAPVYERREQPGMPSHDTNSSYYVRA